MINVGEEFPLGAATYRVAKMGAMAAFDVARPLGPVLGMMADILAKQPNATRPQTIKAFCGCMGMLDRRSAQEAVISCLAAIARRQPTGWAPVVNGGVVTFDDIDMPAMLELAWSVLEANNILSFFADAPLTSRDAGAA